MMCVTLLLNYNSKPDLDVAVVAALVVLESPWVMLKEAFSCLLESFIWHLYVFVNDLKRDRAINIASWIKDQGVMLVFLSLIRIKIRFVSLGTIALYIPVHLNVFAVKSTTATDCDRVGHEVS